MSCIAHALHDEYTDLTYVMLPVWQTDFGLSFATLAALRGLYAGAMAGFQLPAGRLAEHFGGRAILASGTMLAAAGWALAGNMPVRFCPGAPACARPVMRNAPEK